MARAKEFCHTLFALEYSLPRRIMSTAAVKLLTGTNTLEVEEESDEIRLYSEHYFMTSPGLLATSLLSIKKI